MSKDDRAYSTRANEIHPFFKAKREWSNVKDKILKSYITCYLRMSRSMDALDWIARVTSHVPKPHEQMVRYYGWYSNASR